MNRFRLSAEAAGVLKQIWEYIAEDSFDAADRILDEIEEAFHRVSQMPRIGHRRQDLTKQDVLFWPVGSYLIVYEPDSDPLEVVAVLHGKRNISKILKKR